MGCPALSALPQYEGRPCGCDATSPCQFFLVDLIGHGFTVFLALEKCENDKQQTAFAIRQLMGLQPSLRGARYRTTITFISGRMMNYPLLSYLNQLSTRLIVQLFLAFSLFFPQWAIADIAAKTVLVKNQVFLERQETAATPIKRGDDLRIGDIIRTGPSARAVFRFNDGSVLTVGENSEIRVTQFKNSVKEKKGNLDFVKGVFRMITGEITKTSNPNFVVDTPIGSIGVRGTDFWGGNLNTDTSIDVVLLESEHKLEIKNEFGKVYLTKPFEGTTLQKGMPPLPSAIWSDEKLQRAFKTVATD